MLEQMLYFYKICTAIVLPSLMDCRFHFKNISDQSTLNDEYTLYIG